jgi:hypothetical protein
MIRFVAHRKPDIRQHLAGCQLAWAVVRVPVESCDLEGYGVSLAVRSAVFLGCAFAISADFYRFTGADHLASLSAGYIAEMIAVLIYQADTNSRQSSPPNEIAALFEPRLLNRCCVPLRG